MQIDLTYRTLGLFTAFFAESKQGELAWNEIARQTEGTGKILTTQLKSTLAQLRKAGYKVAKSKNNSTIDEVLLDELFN